VQSGPSVCLIGDFLAGGFSAKPVCQFWVS